MTIDASVNARPSENGTRLSLSTAAARNLATTTKSAPQMQGISSRWLLRMLPWVEVHAGTYRVNRRLRHTVGLGRVSFVQTGDDVRVAPLSLAELPVLRGLDEPELLSALADRFARRDVRPGETLVSQGAPIDRVYLVAHGRIGKVASGKYDDSAAMGVLTDGDHFGDHALALPDERWQYTATAQTAGTVLILERSAFDALAQAQGSAALRDRIREYLDAAARPQDQHGQAAIDLAAGHEGEVALPGTFVDYELSPREYSLAVAQTVLKVHSRVADLFNDPMNQIEEQLKLTVHALRERQEFELVNNRDFGLLHNAQFDQRISTHSGPPTPDDIDELLSMRRKTDMLLAHPRAIAAFLRECNKRGLMVSTSEISGKQRLAWRGVPFFPSGKIPVGADGTSSIIAMRLGEDEQGVVGLRQTGIPDEREPGLNVRFMGLDDKALISYLVSVYFSVAVLVPDAIGILENADVATAHS